jgi:hypothetical protein
MSSNRNMPKPNEEEVELKDLPPVPEGALAINSGPAPLSNVKVEPKVQVQAGGVQVQAMQKGVFKNSRKAVGEIFMVPSMKHVGSWMKCVDPKVEAQHQELLKAKKIKLGAGK